ncbi:MAG: hypothetical protein ACI3ZI_00255 [Candidatus Cryptobacteroides sp.]
MKNKLPFIKTSKSILLNSVLFNAITLSIGIVWLVLFPEGNGSVYRRLRGGVIIYSIITLLYSLIIPFIKNQKLIYFDFEGIEFRDVKEHMQSCRWENMKSMSFMHIPTTRNPFKHLTPYVIKIETNKGDEMFLDYRFKVVNLYKFRRILREASGRDDILQSKGPLWTKIF